MISKELLSEVLETKAWDIKISNNILICLIGDGSEYRLNIHELAHKCKEWACTYKYLLESGSTEPEAIFKACQWILDQGLLNDKTRETT